MTSPDLCDPLYWLLVICGYLNVIELKLNYSLSHTSHISRAQSLHVPNGYHVGQCRSRTFLSWQQVLRYSFVLEEHDCPQDVLGMAFPTLATQKNNRNKGFCWRWYFILKSLIDHLDPPPPPRDSVSATRDGAWESVPNNMAECVDAEGPWTTLGALPC